MEKPKFRSISIIEPVLSSRVIFCCGDKDDMKSWMEKRKYPAGPDRWWEMAGFYTCFRNESLNQIRRIVWVDRASNFYALYHETVHLVVDIFRDKGIPFDSHNEEVIAYFQEHWFRQMWHHMGIWNDEDIKMKSNVGDIKQAKKIGKILAGEKDVS